MKLQFVSHAAEREFNKLNLPKDVAEDFAKALDDILTGRAPALPTESLQHTVGKGAIELKINGSPAYRLVYVSKYNDTLYILHTFKKTTNGVDRPAMKLAEKRYKEIPT